MENKIKNIKVESIDNFKQIFTDLRYGGDGCSTGEFCIKGDFFHVDRWFLCFYNEVEDIFFITDEDELSDALEEVDDDADLSYYDDCQQEYTPEELKSTDIGKAIEDGTFYFGWF